MLGSLLPGQGIITELWQLPTVSAQPHLMAVEPVLGPHSLNVSSTQQRWLMYTLDTATPKPLHLHWSCMRLCSVV